MLNRGGFEFEAHLIFAGLLVEVAEDGVGDGVGLVGWAGDNGRRLAPGGDGCLGSAAGDHGPEVEAGNQLWSENGLQIENDLGGQRVQVTLPDGVFAFDDER